jgi:molybdopterin converting factor subunit 1
MVMPSQIHITVLYFAGAKDATGKRKESIKLPEDATIRELLLVISSTHPRIRNILNSMQIAVNYKVVDFDTVLKEADEVALLPPVSGG